MDYTYTTRQVELLIDEIAGDLKDVPPTTRYLADVLRALAYRLDPRDLTVTRVPSDELMAANDDMFDYAVVERDC